MIPKMKSLVFHLLSLAAIILTVGCTAGTYNQGSLPDGGYPIQNRRSQETAALNEQLLSAAQINTDSGDYLLGPGDLIQVTVFESEQLNTKVRVSSRGFVTLPLLGQMEVKGLTARDAEVKIENGYKQRYIKDPHVGIFVEEHFSQRVTLMGQFKNPGTYDYLSKMRLIDVMALGGGLTEKAGRTAQVRRMGESGKMPSTYIVDIEKMIREGRSEMNIEINGGDVIFVPEAGVFYVDGAVRKPGAYPISRHTNLMEALSVAGGLEPYANKNEVVLIRHDEKGERDMVTMSLDHVDTQDTPINDRDVIVVKTSALSKMVYGFGIQLGIPGVASFGYKDPER